MSEQNVSFLLDAYALIFRGYYAFIKPKNQFKGMDTGHSWGFNSLMDVIKPDHLAVAFDNGGSQLRNEIFPEYKAHRDATPEY
jgi:DNA polymerase-1